MKGKPVMHEWLIFLTLVAVLFFAITWHDKPAHQPVKDERAREPQNGSQELRRTGRNPRPWRITLLRSSTGSSMHTKPQCNAEEVRHA
jgi:hypothetical protein